MASKSRKKPGGIRSRDAADRERLIARLKNRVAVLENELKLRQKGVTPLAVVEGGRAEEQIKESVSELLGVKEELAQQVAERTAELRAAHQSLVEKSRYLEAFFNHTITPLVLLDRDFNFIRVNEAYAKACQRGVNEFPGHNHFELYPSDSKGIFEDVVRTRKPVQVAARPFVFPDHQDWGVTYWNWTLTPLLDDRGEVEALVFALEDVTEPKRNEIELERHRDKLQELVRERTSDLEAANDYLRREIAERKRAEEALRNDERFLNSVLDCITDGISVLDRDMNIVRVNRTMEAWHPDALPLVGKKCYSAYHSRPEPCPWCISLKAMKERRPQISVVPRDVEGKTVGWQEARAFPLLDEGGNVVGVISHLRDITERKQAEDALKKSRSDLARSQEMVLLHNWAMNFETGEMEVSDQAYRNYGYEIGEVKPTISIFLSHVHPDDRVKAEHYLEMARSGRPDSIEYRLVRRDGAERIMYSAIDGFVRDSEGKVVLVYGIGQDITERKRAEKELQQAKMQAELYLDLMGHDISNMHQVALGYLELARDMPAGGVRAEFIGKSVEVLQRSTKLIGNVRKLQKLREGVFQSIDMDVCRALANVRSEYGAVPDKTITLSMSGHDRCIVRANELLHDVFANLVGNATKHTGRGAEISITLNVAEEQGRRYCRVAVEDNGPGIPDSSKKRIFNRMHNGSASGMGLGLYLVKSLVESYGGKVWAEDRVQGDRAQGARFVVMLPVVEK